MDGLNVNWKLLELLQKHRIENDPLAPDRLPVGSCGLKFCMVDLTPDKIVQVGN